MGVSGVLSLLGAGAGECPLSLLLPSAALTDTGHKALGGNSLSPCPLQLGAGWKTEAMVRDGKKQALICLFVCLFTYFRPGYSKSGTTFFTPQTLFSPDGSMVRATWLGWGTDCRALWTSLQRRGPTHPEAPRGHLSVMVRVLGELGWVAQQDHYELC